MGIAERKERDRSDREKRIVTTARRIADSEGWDAVTVRRLAKEIEYSQPVLYSHFESRGAIIAAAAIEGFRECTTELLKAKRDSPDRRNAAEKVALAYLKFAFDRPAVYEAMFTLPTSLRFADGGTRPEMKAAFAAIAAVAPADCPNVELATETFWAALHGLAELERSGRIRAGSRQERVGLIVERLMQS